MLDLEVHPSTREPYLLANEYIVPSSAMLSIGSELKVRIDPSDASKLAIDWDASLPGGPAMGEVRPL